MRIPNTIFNYNLSPAGLMVYCALLGLIGKRDAVVLKTATIAERAGLSVSTVRRELAVLRSKQLVIQVPRYMKDRATGEMRRVSDRFMIKRIAGAYFHMNTEKITKAGASASAFICYAFLLKCSNKNGKAFPSLAKIAAVTGMCRTTVVRAVSELQQLSLMIKAQYTRLCGCFGNNNYSICADVPVEEQKNTCTTVAPAMHISASKALINNFKSIINRGIEVCQGLFKRFSVWGGLNLTGQRTNPQKYVNLKEESIVVSINRYISLDNNL